MKTKGSAAETTSHTGRREDVDKVDAYKVDADKVIAALAARQHGVVTRDQLRRAGLTDDAIDGRLARGTLIPLYRGVYRVGPIVAPLAREMAACLACGRHAWVGHASAAALWQLLPAGPGDVDVVVKSGHPQPSGVRVHRVPGLREDEVMRHRGIPITRVDRTLLDLAGTATPRDVERAVAEAFARRLTTRADLQKMLERWNGRPGTRALRAVLDSHPAFTRSEAEELFLGRLRRAKLPEPEVNVRIGKFEVDFYWRMERLVAEIDGFAYHAKPDAYENDRHRDLVLTSRGLRAVRITWQRLTNDLDAVIAEVAQALVWGQ